MKSTFIFLALSFVSIVAFAQEPEQFKLEIEPITISNAPKIHSYSWGMDSNYKWLITGGRIDGLHQRQPFAAFLEKDNNKNAFVIDVENNKVYSKSLSTLPVSLFEQLQSTNQEFYQRDGILYIFGGYGYSASKAKHVTFPYLTAIDVNGLTNAIINNLAIDVFFRQIEDSIFAVTGGQIGYLDSVFYLVGGQLFDGSYNPMGPDHGPGFTQIYTEEIRKFKIEDDRTSIVIKNYEAIFDADELHRRDYNMAPQIFPNGEYGFTAFSGVFQKNVDLPFLNTVDITSSNYFVKPDFNQYLSQYHSAKLPMYDSISNTMQTIFFGGMSQFTLDDNNLLKEDQDVPFVKTISKISRFKDGSMKEIKLPVDMPTLVGSGAEFIPHHNSLFWKNEIVRVNQIPQEKTLIGYIYGGIESSAKNIFFINNGSQSSASNVIFKVYINKSTVGIDEDLEISGKHIFNLNIFPNPSKNWLNISFFNPNTSEIYFNIVDISGREVMTQSAIWNNGKVNEKLNISNLPSATYVITISNGIYSSSKTFIKR